MSLQDLIEAKTYYELVPEDSTGTAQSLSSEEAKAIAQAMATERGKKVYVVEVKRRMVGTAEPQQAAWREAEG